MNTSLNPQTEAGIDAQIEALIKQKELLRRTDRVVALKQAADLVSAWKISPGELFPSLQDAANVSLAAVSATGKTKRRTATPKYFHPATNTYWSGRGLTPTVFKGVDIALYAIDKMEDPGLDPAEVEQAVRQLTKGEGI